MRNKIIGVIGAIWGLLIVANGLFTERAAGSEAYETGQVTAIVLGIIMFVAGVYYFLKKPNEPRS